MTDPALPRPQGWKVLVRVPDAQEKFKGTSLYIPDAVRTQEEHGTTVLQVVDMGPLAYTGEKYADGEPWCEIGDHVLVRTYSGTRFKVLEKEYRLINDDQVEAVVPDPTVIKRFGE